MRYLPAGSLRPALAALACLASATVGATTSPATDIPARQEVLTFTSLTLSDQQFLTGDKGGTEVLLGGVLSLPPGKGKVPVVILQHGSGGVGANITYWQRQFNQVGIATFAVDGFSGRGITSTASDQAQLGRLNFVLDDYRAGALLARHARIDPGKILLMGFSRGGQASLYAALERFDRRWKSQDFQFAGYLSFYPDCSITFREQNQVVAKPLRVYHGLADNYDPYSRCEGYFATLKQQGADLGVHTYPHAEHGFDSCSAARYFGVMRAIFCVVGLLPQDKRNFNPRHRWRRWPPVRWWLRVRPVPWSGRPAGWPVRTAACRSAPGRSVGLRRARR